MANSLNDVIFQIAKRFNRMFGDLKGFYLFGACVDGNIHEDEDIELVALFETEDKSKREKIWPIIGNIESEMKVSIDLYPYTEEEFKADEDLYELVMEEGIFYNKMGINK